MESKEINRMNEKDIKCRVAAAVHEACLKTARQAYENAGISGLCAEGRWECAVEAIRLLDVEAVVAGLPE